MIISTIKEIESLIDRLNPDKRKIYGEKLKALIIKHAGEIKRAQIAGITCNTEIAGYMLHLAELAKKYKIVEPFFIGKNKSLFFVIK